MKEIEGWVKIKKYTDDDGKPVCGECKNKLCYRDKHNIAGVLVPGPTCQIWYSESKGEWQPIETAPKDGTDIILLHGELCAVGSYDYGWYPSNITTSYDMARALLDFTPTQWMPLPAPPQENKP